MRFSSGRHEPQLLPHSSRPCNASSCASGVPLIEASAASIWRSLTSKQLQTCLPRAATATGAFAPGINSSRPYACAGNSSCSSGLTQASALISPASMTPSRRASAALAGIGGALYAHTLQFISPDQFNILQSVDLVLMIVIGGIGSIHGAFLGAIFLITMPQLINLTKDYLPATIGQAPGLQGLVYGLVLIGFVLFEPLGLYGRWLKLRTYLQIFPFYRKGMFQRQKSYLKSDRLK